MCNPYIIDKYSKKISGILFQVNNCYNLKRMRCSLLKVASSILWTLDAAYLRGLIVGILSILQHVACPENVVFHFMVSERQRDLKGDFSILALHIISLWLGRIIYLDSDLVVVDDIAKLMHPRLMARGLKKTRTAGSDGTTYLL